MKRMEVNLNFNTPFIFIWQMMPIIVINISIILNIILIFIVIIFMLLLFVWLTVKDDWMIVWLWVVDWLKEGQNKKKRIATQRDREKTTFISDYCKQVLITFIRKKMHVITSHQASMQTPSPSPPPSAQPPSSKAPTIAFKNFKAKNTFHHSNSVEEQKNKTTKEKWRRTR